MARRTTVAVIGGLLSAIVLAGCSNDTAPEPRRTVDDTALLDEIGDRLALASSTESLRGLVVSVDGKQVLERSFDWPADSYWDVGWMTPTIISTLIGIAIDEGRIGGVEQTLDELLPQHRRDMTPALRSTTLAQVLQMSAGFRSAERDGAFELMSSPDPVAGILRAVDDGPGTIFSYSNHGAHVLAAVLARATGTSVLEYARSRLFDPLGIVSRPVHEPVVGTGEPEAFLDAEFAWPRDSTGLALGWGFLKLRVADLVGLGQLYLDRGEWEGHQVVPADWVRAATRKQMREEVAPLNGDIMATGYGYGWWTTEADGQPAYFTADPWGHLVEVVPSRSLVVVVMSEPSYEPNSAGVPPSTLTTLVDEVIAPAVAR